MFAFPPRKSPVAKDCSDSDLEDDGEEVKDQNEDFMSECAKDDGQEQYLPAPDEYRPQVTATNTRPTISYVQIDVPEE